MGKLLEFDPLKEERIDLEDAYHALTEAESLIEFAVGAFPEDSVDFIALGKCQTVLSAVLVGIETTLALREIGVEPPDRTYHGDDEGD